MRIEVHLLLVAAFGKHRTWRIDAISRTILGPVALGIACGRICRILAGSRVEQHLRIEDVVVLICRAKHTEVTLKTVVEGMLCDVYLCHKVVVVLCLYYGVMVDISKRGTIVGLIRTATESQVMVLHKSRPGYHIIEVGVVAAVVGIHTELLCCGNVLVGRQHIEFLRHRLEADISLIGYLETLACTLLGLHLNYTRSATRTIKSRFGRILKHRKALYVGRINGRQCGNVARHTIYNDKRVVAANYRRGTTHTHRRQLSHTVHAIRRNVKTCRIAVQHIKSIVHNTFVLYLQISGDGVALHMQLLYLRRGRYCGLQRQGRRCKHVLV